MHPLRPYEPIDTLKQFLHHDRHVLRFYCYWDDRGSMFGDVRYMVRIRDWHQSASAVRVSIWYCICAWGLIRQRAAGVLEETTCSFFLRCHRLILKFVVAYHSQ